MKSVVQAGWLLTTAIGNMFDVIIASVHIPSQVCSSFTYSLGFKVHRFLEEGWVHILTVLWINIYRHALATFSIMVWVN